MNNRLRLPTIFCTIYIIAVFLAASVSYAAEPSTKTIVRVSCGVNSALYRDDKGKPQGHCAEYLSELARINQWELHYVEGSWTQCYQKFLQGDIDLLFPTSISDDRKKLMNFSSLLGGYQLVALFAKVDSGYCYEDYESFQNKIIAVTPGSSNERLLKQYAEEHGFSYSPVYIESTEEKQRALRSGTVDLAVFSTQNSAENLNIVGTINVTPFYYAVKKDNWNLLKQLNMGMNSLLVQQPDLVAQVFSETAGSNCNEALTREETDYIQHSDEITIGFYLDTAPLAETHKDGTYQGVYIDLLEKISQTTGLRIKLYPIDRSQYGLDLVRNGTIDFIIGSSDTALGTMHATGLIATKPFMDYSTVAVTKQNYEFMESNAPHFALTSARRYWEEFLYARYPNAQITYYKRAQDCLNAVWDGNADVTLLNTIEYNYQSKNPRFSGLIEWESFRMKSNTVMVASSNVDTHLLSVINKACKKLKSDYVQDSVYYYLNIPYHSYQTIDILYNARLPIVFGIVCALILALILRLRKKNFRALENKNQALTRANAAKTDFLSRMSHDMRTPMNGILGLAALMKGKKDLAEIQDDLNQIEYSGKYLLSLINDTLDMNRIEAGKLELHLSPINSEEVFRTILVNAQALASEKGVELKIESPKIPHNSWINVIADSSRLQQVLMNLISNAVKYTPAGGTITLVLETATATEEEVTDRYIIRDTGIGMSEDFLPHLYEPFTQEGRLGVDRQTGTGLGMAIVKQLVGLMNGSISVKSKLNEGTEFTLLMHYPVYHGKLTASAPNYSENALRGKKILLCEDHPLNTKIAVQLLERAGIIVQVAKNGKVGVEQFAAHPAGFYDLILMDIRMPIMDGYDATRKIRAMNRADAKTIPIVAMTANAFAEDCEKAREAGMNEHLSKPIDPQLLYKTIQEQIKAYPIQL